MDKAAHFVLYGILGLLVVLGWKWAGRTPRLLWLLLLALLVGVADELNQRRIQDRSAEVADWLADALGIMVGSTLLLRFMKPESESDVV